MLVVLPFAAFRRMPRSRLEWALARQWLLLITRYGYGPPDCEWGYYSYYPYACAPYGYYGPSWFSGGLFIGAGPWYHWGFYGHPGYYGCAAASAIAADTDTVAADTATVHAAAMAVAAMPAERRGYAGGACSRIQRWRRCPQL